MEEAAKKEMSARYGVYRRLAAGRNEISGKFTDLASSQGGRLPLQRAGAGSLDEQNKSLLVKIIAYFLTLEYGYQVDSTNLNKLSHLNSAIQELLVGQEPAPVTAYLVHVAIRAVVQYEENGTRMAADVRKFFRLIPVLTALEKSHEQMNRDVKINVLILLFRFSTEHSLGSYPKQTPSRDH